MTDNKDKAITNDLLSNEEIDFLLNPINDENLSKKSGDDFLIDFRNKMDKNTLAILISKLNDERDEDNREKIIKSIITNKIILDEKPGNQTGGSGHLGYVSFYINHIGPIKKANLGWELEYSYTKVVETEFTIYPDNPPQEYKKKMKILIDLENEKIIEM